MIHGFAEAGFTPKLSRGLPRRRSRRFQAGEVGHESRRERDWFGARDKRRRRRTRGSDFPEPTSCGGFPRCPHMLKVRPTIDEVSPQDGRPRRVIDILFDADAVTVLGRSRTDWRARPDALQSCWGVAPIRRATP